MRTLTGMLAVMLMAVAAHAEPATVSKSLFKPCTDVLTRAELASMSGELAEQVRGAAGCLRLTNKEFVVFRGDNLILERPFQYCAVQRVPECEPEPFRPYSFDVQREFTGANGKRFMLWKTYRYARGVYSHGYGIASLVPKSVESRGFDVYALTSGAIFRGEDPSTADPCQDLGDEATEITGYELLGESTAEVELRFTERVVNCKTQEETPRLKRYRPRNGKFELLP
jgi:hypothetical protein